MTEKEKLEMAHIEEVIGKILRIGVGISCAVMIFGFLLFLITGKSGYQGDEFPTQLSSIFQGITQIRPFAFLMAGLFLLILTPILRVVVSIYSFARERDKLYVGITIVVLCILLFAMMLGAG
ncbi:Uncharacterized membrane protein [Pilibacter termitis]|uniref:Uncharacterized membrane protein n=1 Tax=Pilibacter termitis TaxID=263852 RepID=A0A1T4Q8T6_9ENTE|nr:DUF1634 domain-containing protein [Pilibacter termitis]SJZ99931.1 Uncharacterized membrane protein [Pilibacter termitis]